MQTNELTTPSNSPKLRDTSQRRWLAFAVIAAVIGLGVLIWETVLEDRFIPKKWGVVEAGTIFRSGQVSRWLIEDVLTKNNIRTVIDLNGVESPGDVRVDQEAELAACRKLGIEHHRFPLGGDGTGNIENYAKAIKLIVDCKREGKAVLVHCAAGAQRTGGVVASYRVLVQKKSPQDAYAELMQYGWRPEKDAVLLDYLKTNMRRLSELLAEQGVIDQVPDELPVVGL